MTVEIRLMRETINQQYAEIAKLNRNIEALNHQIRKKDEENARLKERLSKYEKPKKNSSNSSTPPSKESMKDEIVRRTKSLRKPSGKKPGGQAGHDGHKLSCSPSPDEIIDDMPNYCTNCGETLADAEHVLDYVTQVVSIPELKPVIKEIRHYVMICKKCGERVRTAPRRKSNDVIYDASVKSLVVYLSVVQFLPYGRIASFLREVFGLAPSEGSLVNWVKEAKRNAQPAIEKIQEYIMSSSVVGFDESGCYCNKRLDWAWIAQTVYYTLLFRADGRSSKVLTDKFGDSLERMTAVTDRHSAYFALHFLNHQVCLAHLLRELQYMSELNTKQNWSDKITDLFREAIHERNSNPSAIIPKASWLERLDNLLKLNICNCPKLNTDSFSVENRALYAHYSFASKTSAPITKATLLLMSENDWDNALNDLQGTQGYENPSDAWPVLMASDKATDVTSQLQDGTFTYTKTFTSAERDWYVLVFAVTDANGTSITRTAFHSQIENAEPTTLSHTYPVASAAMVAAATPAKGMKVANGKVRVKASQSLRIVK